MNRPRTIEIVTKEIHSSLKTLVMNKRKLGNLLVEARSFFDSDDLFDDWISGNFPDELDPKTIYNYKLLAKVFVDGLPKNIPSSGLYAIAAPKNDDIREKVLEKLGDKKASLNDVKAAITQVRNDDEQAEAAIAMMEKVGELINKDSHSIFMSIVESVGKDTVLKWVGELDQTEQEKAA